MVIKSLRSIKRALPVLVLVVIISGCGQNSPIAPPATPTETPTVVPTRRPKPTSVVPTATATPDPQVNFSGVRYTFDPSLGGATGIQVAADTEDNIGSTDWLLPERIEFIVSGYPLTKSNIVPRIVVFPIASLPNFNDVGAERVQQLADLLKAKPGPDTIVDAIPQLSNLEDDELLHSQVKYLDFENGSGVRFISVYSTDLRPITNADLVYVFQGITADGGSYVAVMLPLTQADLVKDENALTNSQADAMLNDFLTYLSDTAKDLYIAPDASFDPKLSLLDKMAQSFNVELTLAPNIAPTKPSDDITTEPGDEEPAEPGDEEPDEPDDSTPPA